MRKQNAWGALREKLRRNKLRRGWSYSLFGGDLDIKRDNFAKSRKGTLNIS
jgi:hypothetical protein